MLAKLKEAGKPSVEVPEEFKRKCVRWRHGMARCLHFSRDGTADKILATREKERQEKESIEKGKGKRCVG